MPDTPRPRTFKEVVGVSALRRRMRASILCGVRRAADGSIVVILLRSSTTKARCHIQHKISRSNADAPQDAPDRASSRCLQRPRRLQRLCGEWCIGRIYETRTGPEHLRWF